MARMRHTFLSNPLTKEELTKIPKHREGRPIRCCLCGMAGGTLVKDGDGYYQHHERALCQVLQQRRPAKQ